MIGRAPGKEIVVSRAPVEDDYVAMRDAFDAAKRQIDELAQTKRR